MNRQAQIGETAPDQGQSATPPFTMNITRLLLPLLSVLVLGARGVSPGADATYLVTARDAHSRTWSRVTYATNRQGQITAVTNTAYVELETGMHYRDPATGRWADSDPRFEITPDGYALARRGQHQVILAPNINVTNAVDMELPDGGRLTSRPLALSFHDTVSGSNVLIAEVKDCAGQLLTTPASNVVFYPDAFAGLHAALRYTYTLHGFEQDVVLYENPGSPAAYGLDPATTRLEMWTEFLAGPTPRVRALATEDGDDDEQVHFGTMLLGQGQAYFLSLAHHDEYPLPVRKIWRRSGNTTFLVESVRYSAARRFLQRLADASSLPDAPDAMLAKRVLRNREALQTQLTRPPAAKPAFVARITPRSANPEPGFVLDYTTLNVSKTNYNFQGDLTYYISGTVNLSGTNTSFESGCVIKFAPTNTAKLNISSPITWQSSPYRPVIMTGKSDNTVGETIAGSSGNPYTNYCANPALYIDAAAAGTNAILQNLRIAFAQSAIVFNGQSGHVVSHAQFVNCASGLSATNAEFSLRNGLLHNVLTNFLGSSATGRCEHLTVDTADWLNHNSALTLTLTNSLLVNVTNTGTYTGEAVSVATATAFQTVGAGSHYLADDTYRNNGSANINARLASDLKNLTTYPPLVLTNHFTNNTVLGIQAWRDMENWDRGYHYDPLDYCWTALNLTNSTLQLTNGVAVAFYGSSALTLRKGGNLVGQGTPTALNRLCRYHAVQEQPLAWGTYADPTTLLNVPSTPTTNLPNIQLRFTDISLLAGPLTKRYVLLTQGSNLVSTLTFQDSQVRGGYLYNWTYNNNANQMTVAFTNSLLERVDFTFNQGYYGDTTPFAVYLWNDLVLKSALTLWSNGSGPKWRIHDNLFDTVSITSGSGNLTNSCNAFRATTQLPGPTTGNITLTNTDYQRGPLGNYYYPTNGGQLSLLLDTGSRNATNAGLFHYTVTTNLLNGMQIKETNSVVDIGMHFVATDANGSPADSDGEGVPDYLEDQNGNGTANSGETDWTNPDTDYDGRSDGQETLADGTDPLNASSMVPVRLAYWRFDNTNTWVGDQGQLPRSFTNLQGVASWNTNAVLVDNASLAVLRYRDVETNGSANINCRNGTVHFWFRPTWNSATTNNGTGPQSEGRLIELGHQSTNGWWGLLLNTNGTQLRFVTQTNSSAVTNLTATINWSSNQWHQIVLTYSATNSTLYLDGQPAVTNGAGVSAFPSLAVRANGFGIGSDWSGSQQARGVFEDLKTFNYPALLPTASGPVNLSVCQGPTATFSVTPSGSGPFTYVWRKNGVVLPGQTNSTLVISNILAGPCDPH